jgi:hypothetical protein
MCAVSQEEHGQNKQQKNLLVKTIDALCARTDMPAPFLFFKSREPRSAAVT